MIVKEAVCDLCKGRESMLQTRTNHPWKWINMSYGEEGNPDKQDVWVCSWFCAVAYTVQIRNLKYGSDFERSKRKEQTHEQSNPSV